LDSDYDVNLALCLLAFDRPGYFRQVVASVRRQSDLAGVRLYGFLDGAVNPWSGARRAPAWRIRRCAAIFRAAFPEGDLHVSPVNLGVALNYDRAERYVFVRRRHDYALFLEDDFVLAPHYVQTIRAMARAVGRNPRIGAFSAFGDHSASLRAQRINLRAIKHMGHMWAFCTPRTRWLERRKHFAPYLRCMQRIDYRLRSHEGIWTRLYARWGARRVATSQDAAKRIAMLKAGQVPISSYTNNGRYIGRNGVHFTPSTFARLGYVQRADLVNLEPADRFEWTEADLDRIETEERSYFLQ
jgi:hypothetical protein